MMMTSDCPRIQEYDLPVAARLCHFMPDWERITDDQYIPDLVQDGYNIPFLTRPPLSSECSERLKGGPALWPFVHDFLVKGQWRR